VRVLEAVEQNTFIFRPFGFPFGKIGLIVEINESYNQLTDIEHRETYLFPYGVLDYNFGWYYDDMIRIFVEGQQYWVFKEEIEKYYNEGA